MNTILYYAADEETEHESALMSGVLDKGISKQDERTQRKQSLNMKYV